MTAPDEELAFRELIASGHQLMQHVSHDAALRVYETALQLAPTDDSKAEAAQMVCVQYRSLGPLAKAVEYGERALTYLGDSDNIELRIDIERDYAMSCHKLMLWQMLYDGGLTEDPDTPPTYPDLQDEAEIYFEGALSLAEHNAPRAQLLVTQGAFGHFLFDIGTYDNLQHNAAQRRKLRRDGRKLLHDAVAGLEDIGNEVYELNMRLRLMRVSNPFRRLLMLERGLQLTSQHSASSAARRKVLSSLAGNRLVNRVELRRIGTEL